MSTRRRLSTAAGTVAILTAVVLLLPGCAATPPADQPLGAPVELDFVRDGVTTQAECLQRLGAPSRKIPGSASGEVWTYWLGRDESGLRAVASWRVFEPVRYSLVLDFDAGGVLARHSMVKIWQR